MIKQIAFENRSHHILRGIADFPDDTPIAGIILNVHGLAANKSGHNNLFTQTARFLAHNGFASVRFDLYGNGESDGEFEDMTFVSILEDIEDIFYWTKKQDWAAGKKLFLSGHSLGGYAAATLAPKLQPDALLLIAPGAMMWYSCKKRMHIVAARGMNHADLEGLCFRTSFHKSLIPYEPFSTAKGYTKKVLLLRGEKDYLASDEICRRYAHLYGKNCTYKTIQNTDHNFTTIPSRTCLHELILAFLKTTNE